MGNIYVHISKITYLKTINIMTTLFIFYSVLAYLYMFGRIVGAHKSPQDVSASAWLIYLFSPITLPVFAGMDHEMNK